MTVAQLAEGAWAMCSAMFAMWMAALCFLLALMTMKFIFNLLSSWLPGGKKGQK